MMPRTSALAVVLVIGVAASAGAQQERLGSAAPQAQPRPGWWFTPTVAFGGTYDDNVTLFGDNNAAELNDDFITTVGPHARLDYYGRHTRFAAGYGGNFLNYRTFSVFDRWNQSGQIEFKREENARLSWDGHANASMVPSTEAIEFNGVPFSHTGAKTLDGRAGLSYRVSQADSLTSSIQVQRVDFDRPGELRPYLQGGQAWASVNAYHHRLSSRTSVGADYVYRRASTVFDIERSNTHTMQGLVEHKLSEAWAVSGAAGIAYLSATPVSPSASAPAFQGTLDREVNGRTFHVGYMQSLLPSFGYGGTVLTREAGVGYFTPLFHSRRFYTDNSAVFRDNTPAVEAPGRLKLRSFRTNSVFGWAPQPWVHIQGFYSRTMQTSLVAGGRLDRNRFGVQIVTTKPMRMQ